MLTLDRSFQLHLVYVKSASEEEEEKTNEWGSSFQQLIWKSPNRPRSATSCNSRGRFLSPQRSRNNKRLLETILTLV